MSNAQSPLNARLLKMQNANCAVRGVWAMGNGGNRTLLIRHVSPLAALSFASSKVSKFISNNYVAINKPMPAIKGGARATGCGVVGRVVYAGNCRACSALFMQQIGEEGDRDSDSDGTGIVFVSFLSILIFQ